VDFLAAPPSSHKNRQDQGRIVPAWLLRSAQEEISSYEERCHRPRFEARTYFSSGNRRYDVMGMSRDQLISDVLAQSPDFQLVQSAPEHPSGI
jgi:hypothetical protein